jgi:hypothetical protein
MAARKNTTTRSTSRVTGSRAASRIENPARAGGGTARKAPLKSAGASRKLPARKSSGRGK